MSRCKWWNIHEDKCIHPHAPQDGDCDWADEDCPYDEQVSEARVEVEEIKDPTICPLCGSPLMMYEHYDYWDGWELTQEQHFECSNCHDYTTSCTVHYTMKDYEWSD